MRPTSLIQLLAIALFILFLVMFVQMGIITLVLDKLGLSAQSAFLLLMLFLFGSPINLPLFKFSAQAPADPPPARYRGLLPFPQQPFTGTTTIAINVGGGLTPTLFSAYLIHHSQLGVFQVLAGIGLVAFVSYTFSRPVPGLGIGMPILIAPVCAALAGLLIAPGESAALAYIAGTLGVLLGADILRLRDIRKMGTPVASIGGAGTFDGIFITGIVAVLLA